MDEEEQQRQVISCIEVKRKRQRFCKYLRERKRGIWRRRWFHESIRKAR